MNMDNMDLKAEAYTQKKAHEDPVFRTQIESTQQTINEAPSGGALATGWAVVVLVYLTYRALIWAFSFADLTSKYALAALVTAIFLVLCFLFHYLYEKFKRMCGVFVLLVSGGFIFNLVLSDSSFSSMSDISSDTLVSFSLESLVAAVGGFVGISMIKNPNRKPVENDT